MNPTLVKVEFDMEEVHGLSLDLLRSFEEGGVPINLGVVSLAMSLGRLMAPKPMTQEETARFIQGILEFGGMYFADEGKVN